MTTRTGPSTSPHSRTRTGTSTRTGTGARARPRAHGAVLAVQAGDPACLPTIGEALRVAPRGATVQVHPGVYVEHLVVSEDVVLRAAEGPGTVELRASAGPAVLVRGGSVELVGMTVRGGDRRYPTVQVVGGLLRLRDVTVLADGVAAIHQRGGALQARDVRVGNPCGAGVVVDGGEHTLWEGGVVADVAGSGMVVTGAARPSVRGALIGPVTSVGVLVGGTASPELEGCRIEHTGGPAVLAEAGAAPVLRCCRLPLPPDRCVRAEGAATVTLEDAQVPLDAELPGPGEPTRPTSVVVTAHGCEPMEPEDDDFPQAHSWWAPPGAPLIGVPVAVPQAAGAPARLVAEVERLARRHGWALTCDARAALLEQVRRRPGGAAAGAAESLLEDLLARQADRLAGERAGASSPVLIVAADVPQAASSARIARSA